MEQNKFELDPNTEMPAKDNFVEYKEMLLNKRDNLFREQELINQSLSQLEAEYINRKAGLQHKRKTIIEALQHVEGLVKFEGILNWEEGTNNNNVIASIEVAYEALSKQGKPMHYKELAEIVRSRGVYIGGKNPAATLLTRLSRDSRFKRIRAGTYSLSSLHETKEKKEQTSRQAKHKTNRTGNTYKKKKRKGAITQKKA